MERLKTLFKKLTKKEYLPFWFFAGVQLIYHWMMREGPGTDAMWFFRNQLDAYSLKDYLTIRYHGWSSRLVIEAALVYVSRHMRLYKLLDWGMWMLLACSLSAVFGKTKDKARTNWVLVGLLLIYPLAELGGAGWIATTTNYIWPLALGVFVLTGTARVLRGERVAWWMHILYLPAMIYAANAEQMCAVLLGIEGLCFLWILFVKKQGKQVLVLAPYLLIGLAEFLFILKCPGNAARKNEEIVNYLQNYEMYNLVDKADLGFVDTMKHLISSGNLLFFAFTLVLAVLVFLRMKGFMERFVSLIPVCITAVLTFFGDSFSEHYAKLASVLEKNEIINGYNYVWGYSYLPFVLYLLVLLCILVSLAWVAGSWEEFLFCFFLLAIGLASRVVMGFSPTIFVSESRTFLYLYMTIAVTAAALIEWHDTEWKEHPKAAQAIGLAGACMLVISLFGGFMAASAI